MNLYFGFGNNLLERSTSEYYCGDVILNSKFLKVIEYCSFFSERGGGINLKFDVAILI